MTRVLELAGIRAPVPEGWEARGVAPQREPEGGGTAYPYLHLATFPLARDRAPFGGGAVETMGADDLFVALLELTPEGVGTALFAARGAPRRLRVADFPPASLQRTLPGQLGAQRFFHEAGRAFCLYVVAGGRAALGVALPATNAMLAGLTIRRGST